MTSTKLPPAMGYFKGALSYKISAERLHELFTTQPQIGIPLSNPVYFLYHHAAELALKACLMSHGIKVRSGHKIVALFTRCQRENLLGGFDEHHEMHNLMVLLDVKDNGQSYRYAEDNNREIAFVAQLTWVQEGVAKLISHIEPHLRAWGKDNNIPGPWDPYTVSHLRFAFDKPSYMKQPKPSKPGP